MQCRFAWFAVYCLLLLVGASHAAERHLPGRVLRVIDGDSLMLDVQRSQFRIDLWGIDAPELNQPWGEAAADQLHRTLTGRFVNVRISDDGSRIAGRVVLRVRDVALDLLHDGLAWSVVPDGGSARPTMHPYTLAQRQARAARRGLWSDDRPIPPWEWRDRRPGLSH